MEEDQPICSISEQITKEDSITSTFSDQDNNAPLKNNSNLAITETNGDRHSEPGIIRFEKKHWEETEFSRTIKEEEKEEENNNNNNNNNNNPSQPPLKLRFTYSPQINRNSGSNSMAKPENDNDDDNDRKNDSQENSLKKIFIRFKKQDIAENNKDDSNEDDEQNCEDITKNDDTSDDEIITDENVSKKTESIKENIKNKNFYYYSKKHILNKDDDVIPFLPNAPEELDDNELFLWALGNNNKFGMRGFK